MINNVLIYCFHDINYLEQHVESLPCTSNKEHNLVCTNLSVLHELCKPWINSFLASSDFYRLLIIFANSLDPAQDRQNVWIQRTSGSKPFDTLIVFPKELFKTVHLDDNKTCPSIQRVK